MPFVLANDIRIYYEIRGQGPRLLYIGGTASDLRRLPNVFDSPLPGYFEVLAYDQRGMGQTDKPDIPYTMVDYASDAATLLEAVGWKSSCRVMGVSFGGMVAQEMALRYPERVERLVLCCTSSGGAGGASYPLHEHSHLSPLERARRLVELTDTRRDAKWQAAHRDLFQEWVDEVAASFAAASSDSGLATGAWRQLEARKRHDTWDRLPDLKMPVYLCGGRYDGIAPESNLRAMERQIPNARLELFNGGHQFLLQDPRAYHELITFLKGLGESRVSL
jgi:3-oxoadipate enol-lactonase